MFNKLIKRPYYAQKHMEAPLLTERIQYVQQWIDGGYPKSTVTAVAQYLLRIVEFMSLPTDHIITLKEVELAASKWASYKSNHPQKRAAYSKTAAKKFKWFAIDWLKRMNCLEPLPEEKYPLFVKLFSRGHALRRHVNAPLLKERLEYLDYWVNNGASLSYLHCLSQYLLISINLLKLYELRIVTTNEIEAAADVWANDKTIRSRTNGYSKFARMRFIRDTSNWLNMLGYLEHPAKKIAPFENYLDQYVYYMRSEQGLSENTIRSRISTLKDFLIKLDHIAKDFNAISPLLVDNILTSKYKDDGYSRRSVQGYATVIRGFLKYAGNMAWCSQNLWETIHTPRKRLKPVAPNIKHYGPHALRHACATHLINEGVTLKEISDQLGHQGLDTTRIYTKVDLTNLRKVADMNWGGDVI